ncbi:MAG: type II toxin-antitoxin system VapC family toxin [Acidobacteria bacterium]|nr:type II toxin-antitoxin system VapC family toxin [Acidobacteriota bacterium]
MRLPDFEHYRALLQLPEHHRDPFDRLLIVQALTEKCTLVTGDRQFAPYGVPILWWPVRSGRNCGNQQSTLAFLFNQAVQLSAWTR